MHQPQEKCNSLEKWILIVKSLRVSNSELLVCSIDTELFKFCWWINSDWVTQPKNGFVLLYFVLKFPNTDCLIQLFYKIKFARKAKCTFKWQLLNSLTFVGFLLLNILGTRFSLFRFESKSSFSYFHKKYDVNH